MLPPPKVSYASVQLRESTRLSKRSDFNRSVSSLLARPELIRSVSTREVLRGWGAAFGDAPKYLSAVYALSFKGKRDAAESYLGQTAEDQQHERVWMLGRPTETIHDFYSHCWLDGQYKKCLALLFHYNAKLALSLAMAFATLMYLIGVYLKWASTNIAMPKGIVWICCLDAPAVIFITFLCFGHRLSCDAVAREAWLDKICIHQGDDDLKGAGIRLIGEILRLSEHMVVFYSDQYTQRLWCVYELGHFLHHHKVEDITFIPLSNPIVRLSGFLCSIAAQFVGQLEFRTDYYASECELMSSLFGATAGPAVCVSLFWVTAYLIFLVPFALALVLSIESNDQMIMNLRAFSFDEARCQVEGDRELVEESLATCWGSVFEFEEYVRGTVTDSLIDRLGTGAHIPYSTQMLLWIPILWNGFCDTLTTTEKVAEAQGLTGGWKVYLLTCFWWYLNQALLLLPILMHLFLKAARKALRLSSRRLLAIPFAALCCLCIIFLGHVFLYAGMFIIVDSLSEGRVTTKTVLLMIGTTVLLLAIVWVIYFDCRRHHQSHSLRKYYL